MDDGKYSFTLPVITDMFIAERRLLLYSSQQLTWLNTVAEFIDGHGSAAVNCVQPETPVI